MIDWLIHQPDPAPCFLLRLCSFSSRGTAPRLVLLSPLCVSFFQSGALILLGSTPLHFSRRKPNKLVVFRIDSPSLALPRTANISLVYTAATHYKQLAAHHSQSVFPEGFNSGTKRPLVLQFSAPYKACMCSVPISHHRLTGARYTIGSGSPHTHTSQSCSKSNSVCPQHQLRGLAILAEIDRIILSFTLPRKLQSNCLLPSNVNIPT